MKCYCRAGVQGKRIEKKGKRTSGFVISVLQQDLTKWVAEVERRKTQ